MLRLGCLQFHAGSLGKVVSIIGGSLGTSVLPPCLLNGPRTSLHSRTLLKGALVIKEAVEDTTLA